MQTVIYTGVLSGNGLSVDRNGLARKAIKTLGNLAKQLFYRRKDLKSDK